MPCGVFRPFVSCLSHFHLLPLGLLGPFDWTALLFSLCVCGRASYDRRLHTGKLLCPGLGSPGEWLRIALRRHLSNAVEGDHLLGLCRQCYGIDAFCRCLGLSHTRFRTELESTMPTTPGHGCVLAFDIINSSRIKQPIACGFGIALDTLIGFYPESETAAS